MGCGNQHRSGGTIAKRGLWPQSVTHQSEQLAAKRRVFVGKVGYCRKMVAPDLRQQVARFPARFQAERKSSDCRENSDGSSLP